MAMTEQLNKAREHFCSMPNHYHRWYREQGLGQGHRLGRQNSSASRDPSDRGANQTDYRPNIYGQQRMPNHNQDGPQRIADSDRRRSNGNRNYQRQPAHTGSHSYRRPQQQRQYKRQQRPYQPHEQVQQNSPHIQFTSARPSQQPQLLPNTRSRLSSIVSLTSTNSTLSGPLEQPLGFSVAFVPHSIFTDAAYLNELAWFGSESPEEWFEENMRWLEGNERLRRPETTTVEGTGWLGDIESRRDVGGGGGGASGTKDDDFVADGDMLSDEEMT